MSEKLQRHFGSDNYAGICPEALESFLAANRDHTPAYGEDPWTKKATEKFRELFETDCEVFFVFNGTAANSLALSHYCQSFHAVICHRFAHIQMDESGAPSFFGHGLNLVTVDGKNGKLPPEEVAAVCAQPDHVHTSKLRMISLTQATEFGTVYTVDEIKALTEIARRHRLSVHMDGARLANAVASLGVKPAEITWRAGVNVLSFGGTKNGLPVGEAVVFFNKEEAADFERRRKQSGQLASKMRFLAAPWLGLLQNEAWLKHARRANDLAAYLEKKLREADNIETLYPRQANAVFVKMPIELNHFLHEKGWRFYDWIDPGNVRLMTSWDSQESDIDQLVADINLFQNR